MVGLLTHGLDFYFFLIVFFSLIFCPSLCSGLSLSSVSPFKSNSWTLLISSSFHQRLKIFWCPSVTGTLAVIVFFLCVFFCHLHNSQLYILHNISCSSFRYPTSKWVKLGTFHARDERIVQSFPLDEQLFAKYLKVVFLFLLCMKSVIMFEGGGSST